MKARRLRAKYPGRCAACDGPICIGDPILWKRGAGAQHVDCIDAKRAARRRADGCPACDGFGKLAGDLPCSACDATGSRATYDYGREVARRDRERAISPYVDRAGKGGRA